MLAGEVTPVTRRWQKVGIIAGAGALPGELVRGCLAQEAPFHLIRLSGYADAGLAQYPGEECGLAEVGRIIRVLKENECDSVVFAGLVQRPNFTRLKPDWRGAALLPRVIKAARRGDGAMLEVLVETFAAEGFLVVGAEEVAGILSRPAGSLGAMSPTKDDMADMAKAASVIDALGPFDVGQGAVVRDGFVVAIEAAEGTDEMLRRAAVVVARLRGEGGQATGRAGILLKRPKPGQERRVDLPTIGVRTVELAAAAGLAGIGIEAGGSLVIDADATVAKADDEEVFLFAYDRAALARAE